MQQTKRATSWWGRGACCLLCMLPRLRYRQGNSKRCDIMNLNHQKGNICNVELRAGKRLIAIYKLPTGKLSAQKSQVVSLMTPSSIPSIHVIVLVIVLVAVLVIVLVVVLVVVLVIVKNLK